MAKAGFRGLCASLALALTACGGGGAADTGNASSALPYPTSGVYAPVLKVMGSTAEPRQGLSLVHPSDPSVEYVIEDGSMPVTDTLTLYAGVINPAGGRVEGIAPHTLLYISRETVRALPLTANGEKPSSFWRSNTGLSMTACRFMHEADANDFANPAATRIGVISKGPDNTCGTADDVRQAYAYDAATNVAQEVSGIVGNAVRDPKTYAPAYQVQPVGVSTADTLYVMVPTQGPRFRRMITSSPGLAIVELGTSDQDIQLVALDVVRRSYVQLGQAASGANWQALGHDATAYYLYRNVGAVTGSNWTVLRISKSQPLATRIATGAGQIQNAAMGQGQLYLTVQQPAGNKLYSIAKASPHALQQMEATGPDRMSLVLASAGQVHLLLRVSGSGTNPDTRIDMLDEAGVVRATAANALPLALVEASTIDFSRSENRTRFVYAAGVGLQGYGDAKLLAYDADQGASTGLQIGTLPGVSTLGGSAVFAHTSAALSTAVAGQVASSANGSFLAHGSRVFSFKADTPNSLVFAHRLR